jgi:predicted dehydrogenase
MAEQQVRVGIIGAGIFAEECHIPGIQAHAQGKVVAVCARNQARVRQLAERFGVPDVYSDYRELLARPDIDAVTVATPDALHFPVVMAALQAGKHVFCEKPFAMNADEARQMTELAQQRGLVGMMSFTFRYSRSLQALRHLLKEGMLGSPFSVSLQVHWGEVGYPGPTLGWYDQSALSSSGTWADGSSHLFDALAFILGPVQQVSAQMMVAPRARGVVQPDTIDVATCLACVRLLEAMASHAEQPLSYAQHEPGIVHATLLTNRVDKGSDSIEVVGTQGAARIGLTRGQDERLQVLDTHQWKALPLPDDDLPKEPRALTRMMGAFIDAVLRGAPGPEDASFAAGLYTQRAIDAAILSAREQHWVDVEG